MSQYKELGDFPPPYSGSSPYPPEPRPPPPSGYFQTPQQYAPAPPIMQQQTSNNVTVIGQPQPQIVQVVAPRTTSSYLVLTAVLMAICCIHGNITAFLCLVPALICSCVAEEHNNNGEYSQAKSCASYSLGCNICSIVAWVLLGVVGVVLVIVYFTIGFAFLQGLANECDTQCPYGYYTIGGICYCDNIYY